MKKALSYRLMTVFSALLLLLAVPLCCSAKESLPSIRSISFSNATLEGKIKEDEMEYFIRLKDMNKTPRVTGIDISGDADAVISYMFDSESRSVGIVVTLEFDTGSRIYSFTYRNPPENIKSSDARLGDIYFSFGELSPKFDEDTTSYRLYIPSDLDEISINPVPADANAYCRSLNNLKLGTENEPTVTLTCTSSDGTTCNYKIEIKRVNKTLEEVRAEMAQPGYRSFVNGERFYQKPEVWITVASGIAGIAIIYYLFRLTRRISVSPYDKEEKEFYKQS